jgi:hypothetical protein
MRKFFAMIIFSFGIMCICCAALTWIVYLDEERQRSLEHTLKTPPAIRPEDLVGIWEKNWSFGKYLITLGE